jgi:lysine 6-dehydrogenase
MRGISSKDSSTMKFPSKKVVVVGLGRVGLEIAHEMSRECHVTGIDVSEEACSRFNAGETFVLPKGSKHLANDALGKHLIKEKYDLAITAVPGDLGMDVLIETVQSGTPVVDISFFPEDPWRFKSLAHHKKVFCAMDCGIAPGAWNIILGHWRDKWVEEGWEVTDAICYVGGLPEERRWPFEYKAGFSPSDVLEEYTRPARYISNGEEVEVPALTDVERVQFPGVGTLEAFNSDGLRTLLVNPQITNLKEKTLRYPGHAQLMEVFRETGLFSQEPLAVGTQTVRPLDVTSKLLFPQWEFGPHETDFTIMRIEMEARKDGKRIKKTFDMLDRAQGGVMSMTRTTGYTATGVALAFLEGLMPEEGFFPPEDLAPYCYDYLLEYLATKDIHFKVTNEESGC